MKKAVLYIHGKGGNAAEAEHYRKLCEGYDVFGLDYKGSTPWETEEEFQKEYDALAKEYDEITIIANSIGAYFAMNALGERKPKRALFISPLVNMEKLITDMMTSANVTEEELRERGELATDFGEVLSWKYLSYVREHPIVWSVPTEILLAAGDNITSKDSITDFAAHHGAGLTVMENGEHWFHTDEQMRFLDAWVKKKEKELALKVAEDERISKIKSRHKIQGGNVRMFNFKNKTVVVTGGAKGIGKCIREQFEAAGATVCVIDLLPNDYFLGDLADKATLESFAAKVIADFGHVDYLINNAAPKMCGIENGSYDDFEYALKVGVTAPFYLSKLFAPHFASGAVIVNISSSRDRMSQPETESYTAAKGGISALTHALAVSLAGKVRVNSISPGWIDNNYTVYEGADAVQQPVGRVGDPRDIANMVLYLCSDMAGFITGENICIDGGMTKQMIYHGDHGWSLDIKN